MAEAIINYGGILVAGVASFVLGGLWYSPVLFGKKWMELMDLSVGDMKHKKKEAQRGYIVTFFTTLVMAYVLAYVVKYMGASTVLGGALAGFWIWLGFVATIGTGSVLWEGKSWSLYLINTGFYLVSLLMMGIILAVWV